MRLKPFFKVLLVSGGGLACQEHVAGPPPPEPIRAAPAPPGPATAVAAAPVIGLAKAKRGDFVDYKASDGHFSRFSDGWRSEGVVRVWVLETSEAESKLLLQPLEEGRPLVVRVPVREVELARLTPAEQRAVRGRTFHTVRGIDDRSSADGPKLITIYALRAPEFVAGGGVLFRSRSVGGVGGYGGSRLEAVGFGHEAPPTELPEKTLEAAGPLDLVTSVLERESVPKGEVY